MPCSRQKDYAKFRREKRCISWDAILKVLARRRIMQCGDGQNRVLLFAGNQFAENAIAHELNIAQSNRISMTDFAFNFNSLSNFKCMIKFRFCKEDTSKVAKAKSWPNNVTSTARNGYGVNHIVAACIVLRQFAGSCR